MPIRLIAFDFGSTTSKALEASARLVRNFVTGRTEIQEVKTISRSEPVFTPFAGDRLDEARISELVDHWLAEGGSGKSAETIAGGVIVTGLAAKKENARSIAQAVRRRIGDAVIAVADDPGQESWLAFMGSCAALSGAHPEKLFINLDIGGGTTNLALGANKTVHATGSLWVGARHFRFEPGSYRLTGLSEYGEKLLRRLGMDKAAGSELKPQEVNALVDFYTSALEGAVAAKDPEGKARNTRFVEQLRFPRLPKGANPILTFSGGVGELVYRLAQGEAFPTTPYGDLGVDLAAAILRSPLLARDLASFVPLHRGRATVCGLAFHGVEASGSTVFLPDRGLLPLRDLPLLGRISERTLQTKVNALIARARTFHGGSCLHVALESDSLDGLKSLAGKIVAALRKNSFPKGIPLIIFTPQNLGKTLGHYATDWGRIPADLIVIDEIENDAIDKKAYFASIHRSAGDKEGRREQNLLVSFYGGMDQK
jgi:ethanolamine utilization protein EutA